jgi:hypothetical protein
VLGSMGPAGGGAGVPYLHPAIIVWLGGGFGHQQLV